MIPVRYSLKSGWLRRDLRNAAIVDFLFHPSALWWFDHHDTTFVNNTVKQMYRPDSRHRWDTKYKACPSLIMDVLAESTDVRKLSTRFREWIHWSNIIDAALYENAQQAVLGSEPAILINQALSGSRDPNLRVFLAQEIASGSQPSELANHSSVEVLWRKQRKEIDVALKLMKERIQLFETVAFCDVTDSNVPFVRYGNYFFFPEISKSVIAYKVNVGRKRYYLSLSANPWKNENDSVTNLAEIAKGYGGGGRKNVAAISFSSAEECRSVARQVIELLVR
jgi:hypothetical protein